ncbi:hypothetical protein NEOLEDRAFT_727996 [Neolentinus lepideus HHB14362 ss-1]|uniref:Uncharacterized protein n=1 Tax=Neolentinus lepideus HHB14362 ss-1 TaxID=1314782 RepID=A0A165Q0N3_9AGAM|nr:hypothetical protein NEOLEDRAFT_727996 [Neolentinus lepideus HHB14362 ss-1]
MSTVNMTDTCAPSLLSCDSSDSGSNRPSWPQTPTEQLSQEPAFNVVLLCESNSAPNVRHRTPKAKYKAAVTSAKRLKGTFIRKVIGLRTHISSTDSDGVLIDAGDIISDSMTTASPDFATMEDGDETGTYVFEPEEPHENIREVSPASAKAIEDKPNGELRQLEDLDDEPAGWECPCQSLPLTPLEDIAEDTKSPLLQLLPSPNQRPFGIGEAVNLPLRVLFFLPWCILVGAAIMVCPAMVPVIAFRTGYFSDRMSSCVHRLAYYIDSAAYHVFIFVAFLGFTGWYLPDLRLLLILVLTLATLCAWGEFLLGRRGDRNEDELTAIWASLKNSRRVDGDVIVSGLSFQPPLLKLKEDDLVRGCSCP